MKKHLLGTAGGALALALLSTPSFADVTVRATITKNKDVTVTETITKVKVVVLTATGAVTADGAAEADAMANVRNFNNFVGRSSFANQEAGLNDFGIYLDARIVSSITGNSGIVEVNQDVGNMANQGNVLAFAAGFPDNANVPTTGTDFFADAQAEVDQRNEHNRVVHLEDNTTHPAWVAAGTPNEAALLSNAINGNTGIVGVNQNAGNMPNQTNSLALAAGFGATVALSEAALGQVNTGFGGEGGADVTEAGVLKTARITSSVNGNTGVVHVNQNVGNMANQSNVFALAFVMPTTP